MEALAALCRQVFGPDGHATDLTALQMAARAITMYGAGLVLLRLAGHRILGRHSALDIVVGIMLGSILSRAVNGSAPMGGTMAAMLALVLFHALESRLAMRWNWLSRLIKGKPHLLIRDGEVRTDSLARNRLGLHDLEEGLRLTGHDPERRDVAQAWLERNGRISVIGKEQAAPPPERADEPH